MDYKNLFSAMLGFSAVMFLFTDYASLITKGGNSYYIPLFVIVLVSNVLLEIISKYQGKMCETIEGLFTGLFAVLGFLVYMTLITRGIIGVAQADQYGNEITPHSVLVAGLLVAVFIFLWKSYLKPLLGISTRLCNVSVTIDTGAGTTQPAKK